jgi:predicted Zn finger-like uncharacterized protein
MTGVVFTPGEQPSVFTQCSKCETVYRLSADVLRAAGGQVRCGRCGEVFNALARLAENAAAFKKGESPLDLETRADNILQSVDAVPPADTTPSPASTAHNGPEIAHLKINDPIDEDLASEASLEFTLKPGDLDRVFIETSPSVIQLLAAEGAVAPTSAQTPAPTPTQMPAQPARPAKSPAPPPAAPEPLSPDAVLAFEATAAALAAVSGTGDTAIPPTKNAGLEVSEKVRLEMLSSFTHAELPPINTPRRRLPYGVWVAVAVLLSVLLVVQLIVGNRAWLAVHAPLLAGGAAAPANLSAYQLRQWGVTGDPAAKGTLRVRASIMNSTAQLQPYPLLRLSLANRFGTRIGQREFEPADYLGKPPLRMLAPGERVDATLDIVDPGKDAEGFEIDVCLRGANAKITCVGDAAAGESAVGGPAAGSPAIAPTADAAAQTR